MPRPAKEKYITPSKQSSAAARKSKNKTTAILSESDSDGASNKRPRRRSARKSIARIPVLEEGGETANESNGDEAMDICDSPSRRNPQKADVTPHFRRSPRNRNKKPDGNDNDDVAKKITPPARTSRRRMGDDDGDLNDANLPDPSTLARTVRGTRKTRGGETKRGMAESRTLQEDVTLMRARLFSKDTTRALPAELAEALSAVSGAVVPALHGRAASAIVLLTGASGAGKTAVVQRLLHDVREAEGWDDGGVPVVAELHGLLHGGANSAFRAIARALGGSGIGGAQHCLGEISARVSALREARTPLLIVLDEFHRFVHGSAAAVAGQTVLYALFNLLQDGALRAAAVCVTSHVDVADHLEKRVKSRFAPRAVRVRAPSSAEAVADFVRGALVPVASANDRASRAARAFLGTEQFTLALQRQFQRDRSPGPVLEAVDASLLAPIALATGDGEDGDGALVARSAKAFRGALERGGSARDFVLGLAALELTLLLSLTRLERRGVEPLLFDDVYREYEGLASGGQVSMLRTQLTHIEPRGISAKAWERVVEAGLVARAGGAAGVRHVSLAVAPDVVLDALKEHPNATTLVQRWGAGSIVQ